MRVVITGATGNVGTSLIELLSTDDRVDRIVAIARRRPEHWDPGKTMFIEADVATDDISEAIEGCDALVHLAWILQPSRDEAKMWRVNVDGSARTFEAAAAAGISNIIYASSVAAYSAAPRDRLVDETWPIDGVASAQYSRQKAAVEHVLDDFEVRHPDARVLRMRSSFIFKKESATHQRRLLIGGPLLAPVLIRRKLIPFVPHTDAIAFQAMHTSDAAEAYRLALFSDVRGGLNIAADPVLSARDVASVLSAWTVKVPPSVLRALAGATFGLRLQPAEAGWIDLATSLPLMSCERARAELGWEPRFSGRETIAEFFEGLGHVAGMPTPPLRRRAGGLEGIKEAASGIGSR